MNEIMVSRRDSPKVVNIEARPHSASMVNLNTIGDRSMNLFPRDAMDTLQLAVMVSNPIPAPAFGPIPQDTIDNHGLSSGYGSQYKTMEVG